MPKPKDEIDLLAKQISEAARLHTRQDTVTGLEYRAYDSFTVPSGNGQLTLWVDIDEATRPQMVSRRSGKPRLVALQGHAESIERLGSRTDFTLERNGYSVQVSYAGAIPLGFEEGNEIVVTGVLSPSDQLQATNIATRLGDSERRQLPPPQP